MQEPISSSQAETPIDNVAESVIQASGVKPEAIPPIYKILGQWLGIVVVVIVMLCVIFFGGKPKKPTTPAPTPASLEQVQASEQQLAENMAKLNEEAKALQNSIPATETSSFPTAPDPEIGAEGNGDMSNTSAAQALAARENAPTQMYRANTTVIVSNNSLGSGSGHSTGRTFAGQDSYSQFGNQSTGYSTVSATHITNPTTTIVSGEFIHAVLETAIDSDLPGMVRAVISEPVYAYVGSRPLIPAGSRLIGQYTSAVMQGMTRVFVIWNRVVLPDGTTVQINSPGTDNLGMAGMSADSVNTHFFNRFGEAALLSVIGAGAANVGVSSQDEYNSAAAYRQALSQSFQQSARQSLSTSLPIKPTLKVFQGAAIVVFVARDLSFHHVLQSTN